MCTKHFKNRIFIKILTTLYIEYEFTKPKSKFAVISKPVQIPTSRDVTRPLTYLFLASTIAFNYYY